MKSIFTSSCIALFAILPLAHSQDRTEQHRKLLTDAQKIIFLGDSITYGGNYVANFETWLQIAFPERQFSVINMGLGSETVSGLSEKGHAGGRFPRPDLHTRLDSILTKTKPDLVFACYGMNCGIQMPFDQNRFEKYQQGLIKLKTKVEATGAKIIFITPPYYDSQVNKSKAYYTDVLAKYSAWLVSQRAKGWNVIDLNSHMTETIQAKRKSDPKFTVQKDAVHPNAAGHWIMTQPILKWFGDDQAADSQSVEDMLRQHRLPAKIAVLEFKRMAVLRNAWLTEAGHKRPGVPKGLPLAKAKAQAEALTKEIEALCKVE
ncbi:lipolytic enzyme [Oceaniferula spumae]|uniref:Lipolytic enzyme n=1 Tax=Oceaniferula spumae TaxID=2979115 RepID=A0AAT9FH87_9BACT